MNIQELDIHNIWDCKHAHLKFAAHTQKAPLYIVHSPHKCKVVSMALQLICGTKYARSSALHEIREKIYQAKVIIQFTLPKPAAEQSESVNDLDVMEHSSDSDAPCTSKQAQQRLEHRGERRQLREKQRHVFVIKACRDFVLNPDIIAYNVDNGPSIQCSVSIFHIRFFSCTEIIFPHIMDVSYGEFCNGKWLDLLSMEFVYKQREENDLLTKFCKLYSRQKISQNHSLCELTTSVITGCNFLNNARLSHLIVIFNDIRWLFEYLTCNEYTVWFLLPTVYGNFQDITKITRENINFDLMKTNIQLKTANASAILWTQAEKHVQELLLVAVQMAFGYHCQQNIIYLHSLHHLEKHQSFEFFNYSLIKSFHYKQLLFEKNYLQRIFNVCAKLNSCFILEYGGGLPFYPPQAYIIDCQWLDLAQEWRICVKIFTEKQKTDMDAAKTFLQQLEATIN